MADPGVQSVEEPASPTPLTELDISTSPDFDGALLDPEEYLWFKFTAPRDGVYGFDLMSSTGPGPVVLRDIYITKINDEAVWAGEHWHYDPDMSISFAHVFTYFHEGDTAILRASGRSSEVADGEDVYTSTEQIWTDYGGGIYQATYPVYADFLALVLTVYDTEAEFIAATNAGSATPAAATLVMKVSEAYEPVSQDLLEEADITIRGHRGNTPTTDDMTYYVSHEDFDDIDELGWEMYQTMYMHPFNWWPTPLPGSQEAFQTECVWTLARKFNGANHSELEGKDHWVNDFANVCPLPGPELFETQGQARGGTWANVHTAWTIASYEGHLVRALHEYPVVGLPQHGLLYRWQTLNPAPAAPDSPLFQVTRFALTGARVAPDETLAQWDDIFEPEEIEFVEWEGVTVTWHTFTATRDEDPAGWGPRPGIDLSGGGDGAPRLTYLHSTAGPEDLAPKSEWTFEYDGDVQAPMVEIPAEMLQKGWENEKNLALEAGVGPNLRDNQGIVFIATIEGNLLEEPPIYPDQLTSWAQGRRGSTLSFEVDFEREVTIFECPPLPEEIIEGAFDLARRLFT